MQRTNRIPGKDSWPVLATPAEAAGKFVPPPLAANDPEPINSSRARRDDEAPPPPYPEDRFFRVAKATASWAMAQTISGFAAYGAALYPYFLDRGCHPDQYAPPVPTDAASRAGHEPQTRAMGAADDCGLAAIVSLCTRFGSWITGSARSPERQPQRRRD
jgi:hypothetical protein